WNGAEESSFAKRAEHFPCTLSQMFESKSPKTGVAQRLGQLAQVEILFAVTFAAKSKHGVRAQMHGAVYHARAVDSEKRKIRVWHRINQSFYQMSLLRFQFIVFTTKRHNLSP